MLQVKYISETKKGFLHTANEDSRLIISENKFAAFFLFDGVSSARNSTAGIKIIKEYLKLNYQQHLNNADVSLSKLLYDANEYLINSKMDEAFTTCCALYIPYNTTQNINYASIGDSRIYGISNKFLESLTIDDSSKIKKNIITKFLGSDDLNYNDFKEIQVTDFFKRYLLCTDGFYAIMEDNKKRFFEIFNFALLKNIKKALKKQIKNNADDATYILVDLNV